MAAQVLLDRGFGKASQTIDARILQGHLSQLTDSDLAALEARLIASQTGADADPTETMH